MAHHKMVCKNSLRFAVFISVWMNEEILRKRDNLGKLNAFTHVHVANG